MFPPCLAFARDDPTHRPVRQLLRRNRDDETAGFARLPFTNPDDKTPHRHECALRTTSHWQGQQ